MLAADLLQSIRRTIAFFDLSDFPLTEREIRQFLFFNRATAEEINMALAAAIDANILQTAKGFYYLPGRGCLVQARAEHYLTSYEKIRGARRVLRLLASLPFVRAVFIVNNSGYFNARPESDLDLAIITKKNKIWTARFFANVLLMLLNRRPDKNKRERAICLSFFAAADSLNWENCAYGNDAALAAWLAQFLPIYDPENYHEKIITANAWARQILPQIKAAADSHALAVKPLPRVQRLGEFFLKSNLLEKVLRKLQLTVLPEQIKKAAAERPRDVVLSDKLLKLHTNDARQKINGAWRARI